MKKIAIAMGISLLMLSCGEDQQAKVCDCSKLYDDIRIEGEKAAENGEGEITAMKIAREAHKEEFQACEKFHKEVGDEKFYEMSKECK